MDELIVDLKWLESELKNSQTHNISRIISVDITPAVTEGENYASTLLRLKLSTLDELEERKNVHLILKRNFDVSKFNDKDSQISTTLTEAYSREYNFYVNVLPKLEIFLNDDDEKLSPICFASNGIKDLFLEDLKVSGYHISNRLVGLDSDHCFIVFESIAKLHAASYLAVSQGLIDVNDFKKYPIISGTTGRSSKKSSSYEYVADVILKDWEAEWKNVGLKLDKIKTTIKDTVEEIGIVKDGRINVINHGDLWVNNIMFRYNTDQEPESLKFVDFQMPHYNSFIFDLSYFLNTSVSAKYKELYLNDWLLAYCETFQHVLDSQRSPLACPTLELALSELDRVSAFSLNMCVKVRPIIMCRPEDSLSLSELVKDNGLTPEKRRIYSNPKLAEELKSSLPHLLNSIPL